MKKTGELLKKSREEKQLSIHEIGLSLKINSKILKAIEEGDVESLPAKTFLRGFVQSYAQYLKLNSDEVLKLFTSEMGTTKPQAMPATLGAENPSTISAPIANLVIPPKKENPNSTESKPMTITSSKQFRNMTLLASVIVLVTLILVTKRVIDRYQNEAITTEVPPVISTSPPAAEVQTSAPTTPTSTTSPTESAPPSTPSDTSASVSSSDSTTSPQATETSAVSTNPTPPAATNGSPKTTASTPFVNPASTGPTPRSTLSQKNSPNSIATATTPSIAVKPPAPEIKPVETKPVVSPPPTAAPQSAEKPAAKEIPIAEIKPAIKNIELIIEALDGVDIEYSTLGGKNEKVRLEPEQFHTIKTRAGVKVNISNGGAINVIVNGKDVGVPGVLGKPIKLTY
ncbi:MAG: helix-turn-helix domain-containing protein [Bdellovibrionota bacterium]